MKTVAIVGGGLAGLAAGCALAEAGLNVTLFERRPYVGGRASSYEHPGTGEVVALSIRRWFAPGFFERDPASAQTLLDTLRRVDDDGYARTCEALAEFDARHRLGEIDTPIVAVAGANDIATPPDSVRYIASNVTRGRFVEVAQAAHLAPAEQPDRIAEVLAKLRRLGA